MGMSKFKAGDYCWFYSPTEYNRSYYKDRINIKFGIFESYVEDRNYTADFTIYTIYSETPYTDTLSITGD